MSLLDHSAPYNKCGIPTNYVRNFFTYAYLREDGTPYYVGKGGRTDRVKAKHHRVPVPPDDRILFLKTGLTEEEAFRHEKYMIYVLGRKDLGTGILWNFTDGGEGSSGYHPTEEAKKKISEALTGRRQTPEHVANRRKSNPEPPFKGKKHSEETKKRISAQADHSTGRKWYHDGAGTAKTFLEHPGGGWFPGGAPAAGRKWYHDGAGNIKFSREHPGEGWLPGRVPTKNVKNHQNEEHG